MDKGRVFCPVHTKEKWKKEKSMVNVIKEQVMKIKKHQFLFEELVKRDFKKKYKRTALGMLWSLVSPLMQLLVMSVVFTNFFGRNVPHYTIYLFKKIIFQCISLFYFYLWSKKSSIKNFAIEIAQEAQNPILWSATHKINLCDKNYTDEIFITPPIIKTRFFILYFLHLWNSLLRILKILTAERSRNYYKKHS